MISKMRVNVNSTMAPTVNGFCTHCMSYSKVSNTNLTFLFEGWNISSSAVLVGSCIGVFFLSILSECIRSMRMKLSIRKQTVKPPTPDASNQVTSREDDSMNFGSTETLQPAPRRENVERKQPPSTIQHMIQVFLHIVQLVLGYLLMVIVMTFNVWLGIAVVLGLGTGYFICNRSLTVWNANVSFPMKIVQ